MHLLQTAELDRLIAALAARGYCVVGPRVADGVIGYAALDGAQDLPVGWTDEQEAGHYRLRRRDDDAYFGYVVGPHSWKKFLFPPRHRLWAADIADGRCRLVPDSGESPVAYAFLGVRACEVAALRIQDRVFRGAAGDDPVYGPRRDAAFVIVTQCTSAAPTCFCVSMGTGPRAEDGFDLALTEVLADGHHYFVVQTGTAQGAAIVDELALPAAAAGACAAARDAEAGARAQIRAMPDAQALRARLIAQPEHPHWADIAARCLGCANCTLVCPTCFCHTVEDVTDLTVTTAERHRRMDSCFTLEFSDLHGGSVRNGTAARYRQWYTHKFATWWDQFGTSGCTGCGRCVTWCPVGIDVTAEASRFA